MISRSLIVLFLFLLGCGLTKDLKDTRALGKPYYKKLDEMFFKNASKQGFVLDDQGYSLMSSNEIIVAHSLPIKKSLFEQDVINGAVIGYALILAKGNEKSDTDGIYTLKIDDVSNMDNVTTASLSNGGGNIAITVTKLDTYDELNPGNVCGGSLGGGCGAFYINFEWYCICVHPELILRADA